MGRVSLPKSQGGLGIKDLSSFRYALLALLLLNLLNGANIPWIPLVRKKYGPIHPSPSRPPRKFSWEDVGFVFSPGGA